MTEHLPEDLSRFEALVEIIDRLRGPGGCPWDRKQTHLSLREHLLEEAYEVLEALDGENSHELRAELGDLLMQIVMHARLASEVGEFDIGAVIEGINRKLVSRHPHVFGTGQAKTAEDVLVRWEELKKQERKGEGSMLDGVPKNLPALAYSQSVQDRVARVGFDWPADEGVLDKLGEELAEFKAGATPAEKADEFGDILFTLANYARRQGIDLEAALRGANAKFYRRFTRLEELCRSRGLEIGKLTLDDLNRLWDEVKAADL
jgi:tetrapyrrole methylase family protein/MazG family protein